MDYRGRVIGVGAFIGVIDGSQWMSGLQFLSRLQLRDRALLLVHRLARVSSEEPPWWFGLPARIILRW
jgi:hypothetical protein